MKKICLIVGITFLCALVFNQMGQAAEEILEREMTTVGQKYVPGEIIVKFKPGVSEDAIANLTSRHGTVSFYTSRIAGFRRLRVPRGKTVSEMVELYKQNPNIEYAEPNFIAYAFWIPNDPYYRYQWNLDNSQYGGIQTEEAWNIEAGNTGAVVAVVDTGVAYENYTQTIRGRKIRYYLAPDLAQTQFVPGYDFVNKDTHPNDDEGHGTHVTGTIAQSTNNGLGVAGVAFNCSIMPVKVLDKNGSGTYANVADGICFAADKGAKVINLSLGGSSDSITLKNAVVYAYNKGVTIVAASGNDGSPNTISYPAAYDAYCIAVGATRYDETVAYYSNRGPSLDLVAPGGDLRVDQNKDGYADGILQQTFGNTYNDWGYWFYQGTSMAAPHVSGVAALVIAHGVVNTPDKVKAALQFTAKDKGPAGWDKDYGYGIVDAYAALMYRP
ncbi:MAG: S8 family peptidase [Candidatus Omnitrophota bacterium]